LAKAQTGVVFYLRLLNRLSSGEFDVDSALFTRIDRTVDQLEEAADARDAAARKVLAALEPIEAAAAASVSGAQQLSTDDQAALLAIAGGAKLYEHLLNGRMSVTAASGTRIPHAKLRRLEDAGLVVRDTGHPVHAGQPVALTDAGRAALFAARRTPTTQAPKAPARPGASPSTHVQRR
jgi:phage-related tail fiber protein